MGFHMEKIYAATAIFLAALCVQAADEPVAPSPNEKRVEALLKDLDHDNFARRDAATRELRALSPPVAERLIRELAETRSLEVRMRLRYLLDRVDVDGRAVDGLLLTLTADRTEVRPGDTITLTTTVRNLTSEAKEMFVGYGSNWAFPVRGLVYLPLVYGGAFRIHPEEEDGDANWNVSEALTENFPPHLQFNDWLVPYYEVVPADGALTFHARAVFRVPEKDEPGEDLTPHFDFVESNIRLPVPDGETHLLKVAHLVKYKPSSGFYHDLLEDDSNDAILDSILDELNGAEDATDSPPPSPYPWPVLMDSNELKITVKE